MKFWTHGNCTQDKSKWLEYYRQTKSFYSYRSFSRIENDFFKSQKGNWTKVGDPKQQLCVVSSLIPTIVTD